MKSRLKGNTKTGPGKGIGTEFVVMKVLSETRNRIIILMIAACQLAGTSCSKKLYPEQQFQNIGNSAERKRLDAFLNSGTEKELNTKNVRADEIIRTAEQYLGVPHCMGGTTMKCMDCSGLLLTVFAGHGIALPHNSEEQARFGRIISRVDDLRKGDLVFFTRTYETSHFITHSGICAGNNKFIHASSKNGVIVTSINDPWWSLRFVFGTRVLRQ